MRRIWIFLLTAVFVLVLASCAADNTGKEPPSDEATFGPEFSAAQTEVAMDSAEEYARYADCIVRAALLSEEEFDGSTAVYTFKVEKDYTDTAEEQIHVYAPPNSPYQTGHSYYLFLNRGENALYPHAIYSLVSWDFYFDASAASEKSDGVLLSASNAEEFIQTMQKDGVVGESAPSPFTLSQKTEPADIAAEADAVAIIQVSGESRFNPYVSSYSTRVVQYCKGGENTVSADLLLPPGLKADTDYYVFLKKDPSAPQSYLLCSASTPVLEVTAKNAALARTLAE